MTIPQARHVPSGDAPRPFDEDGVAAATHFENRVQEADRTATGLWIALVETSKAGQLTESTIRALRLGAVFVELKDRFTEAERATIATDYGAPFFKRGVVAADIMSAIMQIANEIASLEQQSIEELGIEQYTAILDGLVQQAVSKQTETREQVRVLAVSTQDDSNVFTTLQGILGAIIIRIQVLLQEVRAQKEASKQIPSGQPSGIVPPGFEQKDEQADVALGGDEEEEQADVQQQDEPLLGDEQRNLALVRRIIGEVESVLLDDHDVVLSQEWASICQRILAYDTQIMRLRKESKGIERSSYTDRLDVVIALRDMARFTNGVMDQEYQVYNAFAQTGNFDQIFALVLNLEYDLRALYNAATNTVMYYGQRLQDEVLSGADDLDGSYLETACSKFYDFIEQTLAHWRTEADRMRTASYSQPLPPRLQAEEIAEEEQKKESDSFHPSSPPYTDVSRMYKSIGHTVARLRTDADRVRTSSYSQSLPASLQAKEIAEEDDLDSMVLIPASRLFPRQQSQPPALSIAQPAAEPVGRFVMSPRTPPPYADADSRFASLALGAGSAPSPRWDAAPVSRATVPRSQPPLRAKQIHSGQDTLAEFDPLGDSAPATATILWCKQRLDHYFASVDPTSPAYVTDSILTWRQYNQEWMEQKAATVSDDLIGASRFVSLFLAYRELVVAILLAQPGSAMRQRLQDILHGHVPKTEQVVVEELQSLRANLVDLFESVNRSWGSPLLTDDDYTRAAKVRSAFYHVFHTLLSDIDDELAKRVEPVIPERVHTNEQRVETMYAITVYYWHRVIRRIPQLADGFPPDLLHSWRNSVQQLRAIAKTTVQAKLTPELASKFWCALCFLRASTMVFFHIAVVQHRTALTFALSKGAENLTAIAEMLDNPHLRPGDRSLMLQMETLAIGLQRDMQTESDSGGGADEGDAGSSDDSSSDSSFDPDDSSSDPDDSSSDPDDSSSDPDDSSSESDDSSVIPRYHDQGLKKQIPVKHVPVGPSVKAWSRGGVPWHENVEEFPFWQDALETGRVPHPCAKVALNGLRVGYSSRSTGEPPFVAAWYTLSPVRQPPTANPVPASGRGLSVVRPIPPPARKRSAAHKTPPLPIGKPHSPVRQPPPSLSGKPPPVRQPPPLANEVKQDGVLTLSRLRFKPPVSEQVPAGRYRYTSSPDSKAYSPLVRFETDGLPQGQAVPSFEWRDMFTLGEDWDAIVNASNAQNDVSVSQGGVTQQFALQYGLDITGQCDELRRKYGILGVGNATITRHTQPGLPRVVIHTCSPQGEKVTRDNLLYDAYYNAMRVAAANGVKRIAFPVLGVGVYNFPMRDGILIAFQAMLDGLREFHFEDVRLCVYDPKGAHKGNPIWEFVEQIGRRLRGYQELWSSAPIGGTGTYSAIDLGLVDSVTEGPYPPTVPTVHAPRYLVETFLVAAARTQPPTHETLGLIFGSTRKDNSVEINYILIPPQTATENACQIQEPAGNAVIAAFLEEHTDQQMIAWVHTHPTQATFLSGIDIHTQADYQRNFHPSFFALVVAQGDAKLARVYQIDPNKLTTLQACPRGGVLHQHAAGTYWIARHVEFDVELDAEVVDLRERE